MFHADRLKALPRADGFLLYRTAIIEKAAGSMRHTRRFYMPPLAHVPYGGRLIRPKQQRHSHEAAWTGDLARGKDRLYTLWAIRYNNYIEPLEIPLESKSKRNFSAEEFAMSASEELGGMPAGPLIRYFKDKYRAIYGESGAGF